MADFRVVDHTGLTLVALIERQLVDLGIANVSVGVVSAGIFATLGATPNAFISLFLYQISGNAELRNLPETLFPDGTRGRQPLPLELSYLITAWGVRTPGDIASDQQAAGEEARLLGAVLQALYEHAEVGRGELSDVVALPVWAPYDGLQIALQPLPIDTQYRLWDATDLGYRLSLAYRVRVASLQPTPPLPAPPVVNAEMALA
ncbi:DUF4255 domain-containing protein [Sphingomonas psychrotolerans]|uniref:Pvc16 N-terminal domain-containing protein n=1 Tax=Sphingomonas psychrotolerans TaxID=1327635 RepID=A0A2K8MAN0_9SPHN|nr:DUF4255 domain-containing protein [Sphingomonas psychrotolerans]ATY30923.1 hypothetical protein CVN68_02080 [Sphingomonas psychrotolerans]